MSDTVYLATGQGQQLGTFIAKGGEGAVYSLHDPKLKHLVVKLYDPSKLAEPGAARLRNKVEAMCRHQVRNQPELCWPREPLYDSRGAWLGYAMYRAGGFSVENVCHPLKALKVAPDWSRADACRLGMKFIAAVEVLHGNKILVGDVNTGNVMYDHQTDKLWLIDCDSCQLSLNEELFLSPVGVGAFTAPELQQARFDQSPRTEEAERFAIAVLLYKILMLGSHPFSFCGARVADTDSEVADEATNIRNGNCPLGTDTGLRLPKGLWFNRWSHLPYKVKNAFIQTFRDGHPAPETRTTLSGWKSALKHYLYCLTQGHHSNNFFPPEPKDRAAGEAWAERTGRPLPTAGRSRSRAGACQHSDADGHE